MWISLLAKYWYIPLIILILGYCYISHDKLVICSLKVKEYQQQIDTLIQESRAAQGRAEAANKEAAEELEAQEKEADAILGENVPKDCDGAMRWGIEQSDHF